MAPGLLAALLLTACGGGGDARGCLSGCDASTGEGFPIAHPDLNTLPPSSAFANICVSDDYKKSFVLTYMNENYLFYSRMVPPNIDQYGAISVDGYFYALLANLPASGNLPGTHPVDRYSYVTSTSRANIVDTGYSPGSYGFSWVTDHDGLVRVSYVEPDSPAALAGMQRGGVLTGFSGSGTDLYPYEASSTTVAYQYPPGSATLSIPLGTVQFWQNPVPIVKVIPLGSRNVGYILFLNHSSIAQDKLIDAIATLRAQGVADLVLDLRYNQGGFVHAAQSLASMIAGPGLTGRTFERQVYNGKVPDVTLPFITKVTWVPGIAALPPGYNDNKGTTVHLAGDPLPMLNLPRVYILTSDLTASASEALINALQGVDVNVVQIGTLTSGEPYGSNRRDNCNEAYYPVQYQGFNAKNFGDYTGGLTPACLVHDDLGNPLGNPSEALLNAALNHIATGRCPGTVTQN